MIDNLALGFISVAVLSSLTELRYNGPALDLHFYGVSIERDIIFRSYHSYRASHIKVVCKIKNLLKIKKSCFPFVLDIARFSLHRIAN